MKVGTGVLYLNERAFKFNEGDTVNIGTVKSGDVLRIEVKPKPFTPLEGYEGKVVTNLDELCNNVVNLHYTITDNVYTWTQPLSLIEGVSVSSDGYFIGTFAVGEEEVYFINFNLSI